MTQKPRIWGATAQAACSNGGWDSGNFGKGGGERNFKIVTLVVAT